MTDTILAILKENSIDPEQKVGGGDQTTFEFLEAAILGALDDIEEYNGPTTNEQTT